VRLGEHTVHRGLDKPLVVVGGDDDGNLGVHGLAVPDCGSAPEDRMATPSTLDNHSGGNGIGSDLNG
jgi:hypothetical protein